MRKNRYESTSITDLHESLIINILTFLPLEFIMRCRCVCKTWSTLISTLISTPYFIHLYYSTPRLSTTSSPIQFLLQDKTKPSELYLAQLDEASCTTPTTTDFIFPTKSRFFLNFLEPADSKNLNICSTCRFTGCIVGYIGGVEYPRSELYHIFNPVTGDYIVIQQSHKQKLWSAYIKAQCALVFVQRTNQLKLLIFLPKDNGNSVEIDIQTLDDTDTWRAIGILPIYPDERQFPTFINGLYHWMRHKKQMIMIYSFDAETEVFTQLLAPEHMILRYCSNLGSLDGKLCICMKSINPRLIEFWVMNEYGIRESWTRKFVISNEPAIHVDGILEPMRCLENEDIVILCRGYYAICYNPTTKSCKHIRFNVEKPNRLWYKPFPFVPSLRRVIPI